jgi:glycosyltransferase involved in cell wall biosynthesis
MHIAFLSAEYPNNKYPHAGGIGAFIKTMATALVESNIEVTVFVCVNTKEVSIWDDNGIRIIEIYQENKKKLDVIFNRLRIKRSVKKYIKKFKINLLEAPDWEGLHAFCNLPIPLITRIHGSVTYFNFLEGTKQPKILKFLEKRALEKSKGVVAVSDFSGKITQKVFGIDNFKYEVIYNGVDVSQFMPSDLIIDENTILYFGTLVRKKGVLELTHIFNEVQKLNSSAKLVLVGKDAFDSIENNSTWELMKKQFTVGSFNNVNYLGPVSYEKMNSYIEKAAVCVFPSFAEAFPISWLEAMAMKKPIVASNIGWANESIEDSVSGLLVSPKDHVNFALQINILLNDKNKQHSFGENARNRVLNNFNHKDILFKNVLFYKNILNNAK